MAKDPFLLVSLEENESKNLAQVMSNDTARKILDYLSKNETAAESQIAKEMKLALSTVHYNLQALVKANLVVTEEFHYSEKGKEVLHYSLANKLIIIAPKRASAESFKDKLKSLLPVALVSLGVAGIIKVFGEFFRHGSSLGSQKLGSIAAYSAPAAAEGARMVAQDVVEDAMPAAAPMAMKLAADAGVAVANATQEVVEEAALMASEAVPEAASLAADAVPQAAPVIVNVVQSSPDQMALLFLAGSMFAILVMVVYYFFSTRKKQ